LEIHEINKSFEGKTHSTISVDLLDEEINKAQELFASRGVEDADGFRAALVSGLVQMRMEAKADESDESLFKQLQRIDSAYISMQNKAYLLSLDNQQMELSRNGWLTENEGLRARVLQLTEELQRLKGG
jgi:hypothetical protein